MIKKKKISQKLAETALQKHFRGYRLQNLVSASRTFPVTARVDLQFALDKVFAERDDTVLFGVHRQYSHETLTFANFMSNAHDPAVIAPLQYEEVDIGETLAARIKERGSN